MFNFFKKRERIIEKEVSVFRAYVPIFSSQNHPLHKEHDALTETLANDFGHFVKTTSYIQTRTRAESVVKYTIFTRDPDRVRSRLKEYLNEIGFEHAFFYVNNNLIEVRP